MIAALLLLLAAAGYLLPGSHCADCTLDVKSGLPDPGPLLLEETGGNDITRFLQPTGNKEILLTAGDKIFLACAGPGNFFPAFGSRRKEVIARCKQQTKFVVDNKDYNFLALNCTDRPTNQLHDHPSPSCPGTPIQVNFDTSFGALVVYEVCFNSQDLTPLYALSKMTAGMAGAQTADNRPNDFKDEYFGNIEPSKKYDNQHATFAALLGSTAEADKYIDHPKKVRRFLAKGHLVAQTDFVFRIAHLTTFYYINTAPMWQVLNNGKWKSLENAVRRLAGQSPYTVHVYTGTHEVMQLNDNNGTPVPIYLAKNGTVPVMPVPKFIWKVVYVPAVQQAVAFVAVNNPYLTSLNTPDLILCPDVCSNLTWITWETDAQKNIKAYCCEYTTFISSVTTLPSLGVNGLLSKIPI